MSKQNELIIFGVKNMALEIQEIALSFYQETFSKVSCVYFSEDFVEKNNLVEKIKNDESGLYFNIGFGGTNKKACMEFLKKYPNIKPFTIIHPTAVIAPSAQIGQGCFIQPNVTVSSKVVLGDFCVLNYNVSVGHDSILSDNVMVQPGARVSGNCFVGENSMIGSNSFVYQNTKIGKDVLVDAMTYVHDDLADNLIVSSRYPRAISRDDISQEKLPMWN